MRPPFVLDDLTDVEFNFVKRNAALGVPAFAKTSRIFALFHSGLLPNTRLDKVLQKTSSEPR